jgi:hypothetical protein
VGPLAISLANPKMSDKLQFVVAFGSGRVVETSDKLKFVGHFHRILALLSNSPAVSLATALSAPLGDHSLIYDDWRIRSKHHQRAL